MYIRDNRIEWNGIEWTRMEWNGMEWNGDQRDASRYFFIVLL